MRPAIDVEKLQAIRAQHARLQSDYATRAEAVRDAALLVATLRAHMAQLTTSEAARALIESNPIALLEYPDERLVEANVDQQMVRRLCAARGALATARREADRQASLVRESAALVQRLNTYAKTFREAA